MDPTRQSVPEAGIYRMLGDVLVDMTTVEQALAILEAAAPDPERARHLVAIRAPMTQLATFIPPGASA